MRHQTMDEFNNFTIVHTFFGSTQIWYDIHIEITSRTEHLQPCLIVKNIVFWKNLYLIKRNAKQSIYYSHCNTNSRQIFVRPKLYLATTARQELYNICFRSQQWPDFKRTDKNKTSKYGRKISHLKIIWSITNMHAKTVPGKNKIYWSRDQQR